MKIENILVPYDATGDSENALFESSKLAKIFHAKIVILFVIEERFFSKPYVKLKGKESIESKRLELIKLIEDKASDIIEKKVYELRQKEIDTNYKIEVGIPTEIILKFAKGINADLIVMGKKGLRKLGKIKAIGSVSRNIAENSHIPVVLVDKSDKNHYRKILVPYDLQDSKLSNLVLENALMMKYSTKECQIVVVNIIPEIPIPPFASDIQMKSKITGDAISVREYFKELYQEIKKDTEIEIRKRIGKDMNNIEIRTSYGNIADKLIEFIEKEDIDFVLMGLNPLKGISKIVALGSVSRRLAESIDCPIMLIR